MKIQGKKIEGANEVVIVIPRSSNADIVLKARAVLDMEVFEKICPPPEAPKKMLPGGRESTNLKDPTFLKQMDRYSVKRLNWMVLTSLEATEDLEWEKVDLNEPSTWNNFHDEMKEAGFSSIEVMRIVSECINVNALNEEKIEEARTRFLQETQGQDERINLPRGRTEDYAIWRACERFNIKPPNVKDAWENCNVEAQAMLIAYNQIRELEEDESLTSFFKMFS